MKVAGNAVPVSGKEMNTEISRLRHCIGDDVHVKRQMALLKKGCEKRAYVRLSLNPPKSILKQEERVRAPEWNSVSYISVLGWLACAGVRTNKEDTRRGCAEPPFHRHSQRDVKNKFLEKPAKDEGNFSLLPREEMFVESWGDEK